MLIDINASFGGRESIQRFPLEALEAEMERIPVTTVLVSANEGSWDQQAANDHLMAICSRHSGWLPTPVIQPRDTFVWTDEIDRMVEAGARLFRLDPERSAWPTDSVFLSLVFEKLSESGVAVSIPATIPGLPSAVAAQSSATGVPVVFTETRYFPLTEILPLMTRHEHLYIETSRLTSPGGIALCVSQVGSDRLMFGSGACRYPARIAWRMLEESEISDADREAIGATNAIRVLNLDGPPSARPESESPAITITAPEVPASMTEPESSAPPAIDVHLHDRFPGAPFPPFDAVGYQRSLDASGIVAGVSSSATAIFHELKRGNDQQEALLEAIPSLRGYVVVDPRYPDESAEELRRLEHEPRWIGVKVHCAHSRTLTNASSFARLIDMVAEFERPMLIHPLGEDWPEAMCALARSHPRMTLIAAHAGYGDGPHPTHDAALRVADVDIIVIEFCSTYLARGAIRRGIEAVGVERVLFGSDFPLISLPYMRTAYVEAELTADEASRVYWQNALRLFPELKTATEGRLPGSV